METTFEIRYACHPKDAKNYDTGRLRGEFLISNLMQKDTIKMVYSHFDRMMIGGIVPVSNRIELPAFDYQKTSFFAERGEIGVINEQAICHLMGEPKENRMLWLHNEQAVISPDWSLHSASGTANYSFIWGMAGSDSEMDPVPNTDMR